MQLLKIITTKKTFLCLHVLHWKKEMWWKNIDFETILACKSFEIIFWFFWFKPKEQIKVIMQKDMRKEHNNETKPSCQKKLRKSNKSICQVSLKNRVKKINGGWKKKQEQGNKSEAMEN